jgi:class 3 adenylate cyclase/tetratricopeptide (TPR) repeat protein
MKCPHCQIENIDKSKFCCDCGAKLPPICSRCRTVARSDDKFCCECGLNLEAQPELTQWAPTQSSERKYVTVLFVDISGYTAMAEKLDPEEVKEIVGSIFGKIARLISKYDGFIEKFAGDAVMALFGVPNSHEDDPVRAIKAAKEIHHLMTTTNGEITGRIGKPLSMHIGINTGLVVTGEINLAKGTHGVAGDTLNLASRLCNLAAPNETLVNQSTYIQAEGFFNFERLESVKVKGRKERVVAYRVLSAKELPSKTHRLSGLGSVLIGRKAEMARLTEAVEGLRQGEGSIFTVCGDAGTGKSRLIKEFMSSLDLEGLQWREGHAYPFTQNIPYYPFINLICRALQIEESDPPGVVKEKAEARIKELLGDGAGEIMPYIGGLLSISYPEAEEVSPDVWKSRLRKALQTVLGALARRAPTIICLEDLHWADPSSLELLRAILSEARYRALFLFVYRPVLSLFPDHQIKAMGKSYREILLHDLSPSELLQMVGSLLQIEDVPADLQSLLREKVGGNPFYVEEVINSLIESDILKSENGGWGLAGPVGKFEVPATIHGVVAARLDRLESAAKLLLQESSVIGRTFFYGVLKRITTLKAPDHLLRSLEQLDLIRAVSGLPDLEYCFKHSLIQEVAYNGLPIKQRKDIHERIGLVMEELFHDRLSEFLETLAFHFKHGWSIAKAIHYLVRSGEKSLKMYALEESHRYYEEAYDLLSQKSGRTKEEDALLIDLLIVWGLVFYYRGRFKSLTELLKEHEGIAESLEDKSKTAMFFAWLGFAFSGQGENLAESRRYLLKALELGEQTGDRQVIIYSCAFLIKTCAEMGLLEEAAHFEKRSRELIRFFPQDAFLYMLYLSGKAYTGWFTGNIKELFEGAKGMLDYGMEKSNTRLQMAGLITMGVHQFVKSDVESAIAHTLKVLEITEDPYHAQFARPLLGMYYVHTRQFDKAEHFLREVIRFSDDLGTEYLKTFANLFLGVALSARGEVKSGVRLIEDSAREFLRCQRNIFYCFAELILGSIYLEMVQGSGRKSLSLIVKNLGFILKTRPFAARKAEAHLQKAIQVSSETGAKWFLGQPCLQLGLLYKLKGRKAKAIECVSTALRMFEQCEAEASAKKAREVLDSLSKL